MLLDILTASDGHFSKIQPLLESLAKQSVWPERVVILLYKKILQEEQELFSYYIQRMIGEDFASKVVLLSHLNSDHEPGNYHGYDRDFLLRNAKSEWSFMVDADNVFDEDLIENLFDQYGKVSQAIGNDIVLSPTVMRKRSHEIQSQGILGFSYRFPKYRFAKMGGQNWQQVQMMGGNSLFGLTSLFKHIGFDKRFAWSYEDIDFTYRLWKHGYPVTVLNKIEIYHMEGQRSRLDHYLIGNTTTAYYRARNRILFVDKNASQREKFQYFGLGIRLQTCGFFLYIARFGEGWSEGKKSRIALWKAIISGTKDGFSMIKKD